MLKTSELYDAVSGFPAGCVHGFTGRTGGVSEGVYTSLNMASKWGDSRAAVDENSHRVATAAGFDRGMLRIARQVHGSVAVLAASLADQDHGVEADAIVALPGDPWTIGVLTADCVPLLICDPSSGIVAAVHAGWRGMVAGVIGVAVAQMESVGASRGSMRAAVGPCIEQAAFEVGDEVAAQFRDAHVDRSRARAHVDLVAAAIAELRSLGVDPASIERSGGCTYRNPTRWFSYRRDGAPTGQQLAFIQPLRS